MISSKSEVLNPKQYLNSKLFGTFEFPILDLFRISNLEIRIFFKQ